MADLTEDAKLINAAALGIFWSTSATLGQALIRAYQILPDIKKSMESVPDFDPGPLDLSDEEGCQSAARAIDGALALLRKGENDG